MTEKTPASAQPLLDYFNRLLPLTPEEEQLVIEKFHPHLFIKKQFALQHGDICEYFCFIVRGCLRMYKTDDKGTNHILQFAIDNYWLSDLASFHKRTPSSFNIDALEDTVVLRISYHDLIDLYIRAPKFNRIFRVLFENHLMLEQERLGQLFSSTAEERYQFFQQNHPQLLKRLSQVQIASYLGVTPEFLSRVRNRMAKGDK